MYDITPETRAFLRTGVTDRRLAVEALWGLVSTVPHENACGDHLLAFRNGRASRVKLLWHHEGGIYLAAKRVGRGAPQWPPPRRALRS